ncbi:hypothetical protein LHEJCM1005_10930 [Lactobacillus helveticus]|uniref:hypothetical protein n=1 Tax=Lactobacillus helveticus TaxID=1587 RepID=UPI00191BBDBB|nr:hypothetical protein [Lactobacillus helveticus]GFP06801.1 hypothetical protein LHEJCM1005_10930 [Lactobacillus helveticus]
MVNLNSSVLGNNQNKNVKDSNTVNAVKVNNLTPTATVKSESTFAEVRLSKNAPVQAALDKHLNRALGKYFTVTGAEFQETPDYNDPDKLNTATVYSVRVTSKKAWLPQGTELQIKVKDHKPIFNQQDLQDIMFGSSAPVVVSFERLAHYHFGSGESLNAADVHKVDISVKEAMDLG